MQKLPDTSISEFINETDEILVILGNQLMGYGSDRAASKEIHSIYRSIHTLKGSAQLFGFQQLSRLAHAMEATLDPVRANEVVFSDDLVDALCLGLDLIKKIMVDIKKESSEGNYQDDLLRVVPRLIELSTGALGKESVSLKDTAVVYEEAKKEQLHVETQSSQVTEPIANAEKSSDHISRVPAVQNRVINEVKEASGETATPTLRVNVEILNKLMNLVGELVLVRNQMLQRLRGGVDQEEQDLGQRLNIITSELQDEVMKTRMQPIGNILSTFHRVVRDLAKELKKKIEVRLEGTETELDRTLIEAVKDPLTHIVRNAVDHGIELPEERVKSHKPEIGIISIKSYQENGQVVVEIADNGKGLNVSRIGKKAIEKGLITQEQFEKMTEREVQSLIFLPGFSTADKVSNISGRGVGMDVVRTNIEKIGGIIDLQSVDGEGTTIRLKIPLTLAIIPALIVKCMQERFAIPQVKLVELVRVDNENSEGQKVELLQGKPVYRLRGKLLPLVYFGDVLRGAQDCFSPESFSTVYIVVLNADAGMFGLIVDEVEDSADIVVKPLSQFLKNIGVYSGATVLGDGSVALSIDVVGLAGRAGVFSENTYANDGNDFGARSGAFNERRNDSAEFILFEIDAPGNFALPLSLINRLEEFESSKIEYSGNQRVINYRGTLLPIVSLTEQLDLPLSPSSAKPSKISVIVVKKRDHYFGLEVKKINDIVYWFSVKCA